MSIFYPVKLLADWLTYKVLHLTAETLIAEAVNFFIYDTIEVFILLAVIIFIISIIRSFFPPEKIRIILSQKNKYSGHFLAAALGIITPFCSCSAVPLFIGFVGAGVPIGVTFSFLVASPMINEVALGLLFGMFGWKVALIYTMSGLVIAVLSGIVIGRLKVEDLIESFVFNNKSTSMENGVKMRWKDRMDYAVKYTADIIQQVWIYVLLGIGIGAWIHGYVPSDFLARYAGADKWYAVLLATLLGIPFYSNAAGVIPLVSALTEKGVAMGTTLAFMMAVTGLSLPEFIILKKLMKTKLILIFACIVGIGIVFTGYLFNFILK
jgi:uncharacterized membrane protein YraQ (UPF0718 family)